MDILQLQIKRIDFCPHTGGVAYNSYFRKGLGLIFLQGALNATRNITGEAPEFNKLEHIIRD